MKAKMKRFLRKTQVFLRNNALALLIGATALLTLGVVGLSAYNAARLPNEENTQVQGPSQDESTPVGSTDVVVFENPLANINISKDYSATELTEDKTTGIWQTHQAIDFVAAEGDEVFAVYNGKVENIENSMMDGTILTLKISDELVVVYKSLSADLAVSVGDTVSAGQQIGKVATNITEKADGVHLHLEVLEQGKLVDPNNYFSFSDK